MAARESLHVAQLVWSYERDVWVAAYVLAIGRVNARLDFPARRAQGSRLIAGLRTERPGRAR